MLVLITFGTAVPKAEEDARGHQLKQREGIAIGESFDCNVSPLGFA